MAREFPDKARAAELGDPATDPPLTMRVHPDDDPHDPAARRVIKDDDSVMPWHCITGSCGFGHGYEDEVADWPYTNTLVASAAFEPVDEHRTRVWDFPAQQVTCRCGETAPSTTSYEAGEWWRAHKRAEGETAQTKERGDMGPEAFKGSPDTPH